MNGMLAMSEQERRCFPFRPWVRRAGLSIVAVAAAATFALAAIRTGGPLALFPRAGRSENSKIKKGGGGGGRKTRLYYEGQPQISDYDFDQKMRRLQELEAQHPEHFDPNSPSQRVGGAPIDEFKTVVHHPPMLSIDNVYSLDELREWDARVRRGLGR